MLQFNLKFTSNLGHYSKLVCEISQQFVNTVNDSLKIDYIKKDIL